MPVPRSSSLGEPVGFPRVVKKKATMKLSTSKTFGEGRRGKGEGRGEKRREMARGPLTLKQLASGRYETRRVDCPRVLNAFEIRV
jgi:hypothetical protein